MKPECCHSEPFTVILSPWLVILSGAKNLALDAQGKLREESRSAPSRNSGRDSSLRSE